MGRNFVTFAGLGVLEIHVWTVNDEKLARRMIALGIDGITTDRPDWLGRFK